MAVCVGRRAACRMLLSGVEYWTAMSGTGIGSSSFVKASSTLSGII